MPVVNRRLLAFVALALLAGCSTLAPASQTPTVTPAPVPENAVTTEASPLPPGVTGNAVADIDELARAHVTATTGRSYTWHAQYVVTRTDGQRNTVRQRASVENETTYTYWTNRREAPRDSPFDNLGNYTEYAVPGERDTRAAEGTRWEYSRVPHQRARQRVGRLAGNAVHEYLWVTDANVAVRRVGGQRSYEISGTGYAPRSGYAISNYTVVATVSPDGFVRSLDASYVRTLGSEYERVDYSFAYTRVGNTTVERPEWVETQWPETGANVVETAANATGTP
jgi:hypothetical protein